MIVTSYQRFESLSHAIDHVMRADLMSALHLSASDLKEISKVLSSIIHHYDFLQLPLIVFLSGN